MRRAVLAVVAVVVVGVGGDAAARAVVESRLADRLTCVVDDPHVRVGGWPVVAQLAGGRLAQVSVAADIAFDQLAGMLDDAVPEAVGEVAWSGENGLLVAHPADLPASIGLALRAQDGALVIQPESVSVGGLQVPVAALGGRADRMLGDLLEPRVLDPSTLLDRRGGDLGDAGLAVTGVAVTSDAVRLTLTATDVPLTRSAGTGPASTDSTDSASSTDSTSSTSSPAGPDLEGEPCPAP